MKELLLKRKKGLCIYIVACFIPVMDRFLQVAMFGIIFSAFETGKITQLLRALGISTALISISVLLFILSRMMRIGYMRDILLDIRKNVFASIMNTSYRDFSKQSKEIYISHLSNDINLIETKFFVSLVNVIFKGGLYITSLVVLCVFDLKLGSIMGVVSVILLSFSRLFANKTIALQQDFSTANEAFTVSMSNTFNGLEIVKLNQIEEKFLNKNLKELNHVERRKFVFNVYTEIQKNILIFSSYLIMIGVLIYISILISQGESIGRSMIIFMIASNLAFPLLDVFPLINVLKSSVTIYDKITGKNDDMEPKEEGQKLFEFKKAIEVKNLTFAYKDQVILQQASFTIEKGKKYLIKGSSGAGKSTLLKLLAMVYDNYTGNIQVDDVDYRSIKEKTFNEQVAFIYQDVFLFEDTIRNNVALYQDIPNKCIEKAVAYSGLQDLIGDKEKGLEEMLFENGKNLSGGQRQRISIARAIAKDAEILFIDEGTSSLNYELGKQIEKTFLELDSTVIAISHRYYKDVTENYDYVLELKNGRVQQYNAMCYFKEEASVC